MTDDPAFRTMLDRAGKAWSHRIVDSWTRWKRPDSEISTGLEIHIKDVNSFGRFNARGIGGEIQPPGSSWEPHFRIDRD